MKKLLLLIGLICCFGSASAQTKTAYCDVYMRGGYDCMTVTIMFDSNSHRLNRSYSMGEILNIMAEDGWVLDNDIVIPRHPFYSFFTRHKLHLIMKKEYNKGEDPFAFVKLFCQKKAHIDEVKDDDNEPLNESVTIDPLNVIPAEKKYTLTVGKVIKYNGIPSTIIYIDNTVVTIVANIKDTQASWDEATEYCKQLGQQWRLPSKDELELINTETNMIVHRKSTDGYWTNKTKGGYHAVVYNPGYTISSYTEHKSLKKYILPIAIVDAESVEFQ